MIEELYVIYRPIGNEDDASTDEEQAEKVLFSYPYGPVFAPAAHKGHHAGRPDRLHESLL